MAKSYEVSAEAQENLFEIWRRIALDSQELADSIESEFYALFDSLASVPGQGHSRRDLTSKPALFFPLYSFLVIYKVDLEKLQILAVVRGKRDVKRLMRARG